MKYQLNEYVLDTEHSILFLGQAACKIEPQILLILEILVKNHDRIVTKEELIDYVWGGRIVSDASINNRISGARIAIGDTGNKQNKIKTFQSRGFKYVGDVSEIPEENSSLSGKVNPDSSEGFPWRHYSYIFASIVFVGMILYLSDFVEDMFSDKDEALRNTEIVLNDHSIAIMPFMVSSGDPQDRLLADSISEQLISKVQSSNAFWTPSRTSTFSLRDKNLTAKEVGEVLNVDYLVEGSFAKSERTLHLSVSLVDIESDEAIWNKQFDRSYTLESIFLLQNELSNQIVSHLSSKLDADITNISAPINSLKAYEHFLKGKELVHAETVSEFETARTELQNCIKLEPGYLPAYFTLIQLLYIETYYRSDMFNDNLTQMKSLLDTVRSYNTNSAEIHYSEGLIAYLENRDDDAIKHYNQVLAKNPNYLPALRRKAGVLWNLGRFEQSRNAFERALHQDPISINLLGNFSLINIETGQLDTARAFAERNLKLHPNSPFALYVMGKIHSEEGQHLNAHKVYTRAIDLNPEYYHAQYNLSLLYTDLGDADRALHTASHESAKILNYALLGKCDHVARMKPAEIKLNQEAFALYICGDSTSGYALIDDVAHQYNYSHPDFPIGGSQFFKILILADILLQNEDKDGEVIVQKLSQFYDGKSPDDFNMSTHLLGGAGFHLLSGNPDQAMDWIDKLVESGHPYVTLKRWPLFSTLESYPEFSDRQKGFEQNAKEIRIAIGIQRE